MGNQQIGATPATLVVVVDQNVAVTGSPVTGKVYLDVRQTTVDCLTLTLSLIGNEKTVVHYTEQVTRGGKTITDHRVARDGCCFVSNIYNLATMPAGQIEFGNYEYPFSFTLPHGLPSSMSFNSGQYHNCSVQYQLVAHLQRSSGSKWTVKTQRYLTVISGSQQRESNAVYMEPRLTPVTTCCCFGRGNIVLGGSVSSAEVCVNDAVVVHYAVENRSTCRIKAVSIKLSQVTRWSAKGHYASKSVSLFSKRMEAEDIMSQTGLNLKALEDNGDKNDPNISRFVQSMLNVLREEVTHEEIHIPGDALCSFNGRLISVSHTLNITVHTPFGTSDPTVSQNMRIINIHSDGSAAPVDVIAAESPALPSTWTPIVADAVIIPPARYAEPTTVTVGESGELDDDEVEKLQYCQPSAPILPAGGNIEELLAAMKSSFSQVETLDQWLSSHGGNTLTPENLCCIMQQIRLEFDLSSTAAVLGNHLVQTTCEHLAAAAKGTNSAMYRRDVVQAIASKVIIVDKENKDVVKAQLSEFQFALVESYFA